ncbi:MAG: hypothetical protein AUH16_02805 [Acidobacteria bacterium 13_2_20CM_57_7]|nr:MAG: hypothetical protein AUH16_02805 [Acidobacteria bacterium 13_2_20CM_57_7]
MPVLFVIGEKQKPNTQIIFQDPGRIRAVKLMSTAGTTQLCNGGQPGSLAALRQGLYCAAFRDA